MSVKVSSRLWENSHASGGDLLVLLALADHANEDGECWPGIASLASKTRMSERNVQRILRRLREAGELHVTQRPGKGWNSTSMYRFRLEAGDKMSVPAKL